MSSRCRRFYERCCWLCIVLSTYLLYSIRITTHSKDISSIRIIYTLLTHDFDSTLKSQNYTARSVFRPRRNRHVIWAASADSSALPPPVMRTRRGNAPNQTCNAPASALSRRAWTTQSLVQVGSGAPPPKFAALQHQLPVPSLNPRVPRSTTRKKQPSLVPCAAASLLTKIG